jgi:hypothetical protein
VRVHFVIPIVLLLALGCKGGRSVVGTWKLENPGRTLSATSISVIKSDGTFTTTNIIENAKVGFTTTVVDSGTWTLAGDKMTVHFTDSEWSFQGAPALVQRMQQREAGRKQQFLAKLNAHPTSTIRWNGDDAFTMTESDGTVENLRRVKG